MDGENAKDSNASCAAARRKHRFVNTQIPNLGHQTVSVEAVHVDPARDRISCFKMATFRRDVEL